MEDYTNNNILMTYDEMREKVLKGTQLAIDRMIERKCKDDSYIVVSNNEGKVVKVKARDLKFYSGKG